MTILRFRKQHTAYGTDDFTATLAEREAALGLATSDVADLADVAESTGLDVADVAATDTADEPPPADDVARGHVDAWGNEVISGDANDGPHIIRSQWSGRLIRVCGEYRTGKHVIWWQFDEDEMRPVCSLCWGWRKGGVTP